jgi:hypothetical protein
MCKVCEGNYKKLLVDLQTHVAVSVFRNHPYLPLDPYYNPEKNSTL